MARTILGTVQAARLCAVKWDDLQGCRPGSWLMAPHESRLLQQNPVGQEAKDTSSLWYWRHQRVEQHDSKEASVVDVKDGARCAVTT